MATKEFVLLLLICFVGSTKVAAQSNSPSDRVKTEKTSEASQRKQSIETIDRLVNKNDVPKFVKDQRRPVFSDSYDWDEYRRVWRLLRELAPKCDVMYPELVEHLDDPRYCMTAMTPAGGYSNWTIGDICQMLVEAAVSAGYVPHVRPESKVILTQMRNPEVVGKPQLKKWCNDRKGKPLFELQMEMCDWAIAELKSDRIVKITDENRIASITNIQAQKRTIAESKTAVSSNWFRGDAINPLSPRK